MGDAFVPTEHQHRRFNPLNGKWILISPHRMLRPWSGQSESVTQQSVNPEFDPSNSLCPGSFRSNGTKNPYYMNTFVFTNDFPALLENTPDPPKNDENDDENFLFQIGPAKGVCRVMCFHPKSNITLPQMTHQDIIIVIKEWINQYNELSKTYTWVQIFENKGTSMGCSNPHPHCQIWASSFLPTEPSIKDANLRHYYQKYQKPLLDNYVIKEYQRKERIVIDNPDWLVIVPYWASWPYETMLISRNSNKRINDLTNSQIENLAITIKQLTTKYDNLFKCSFPYSMGFHGAPTGDLLNDNDRHWTLHAIYYPPLLRSASVRKFMVGYELLCEVQRDITPEQAAKNLRNQSVDIHYSQL